MRSVVEREKEVLRFERLRVSVDGAKGNRVEEENGLFSSLSDFERAGSGGGGATSSQAKAKERALSCRQSSSRRLWLCCPSSLLARSSDSASSTSTQSPLSLTSHSRIYPTSTQAPVCISDPRLRFVFVSPEQNPQDATTAHLSISVSVCSSRLGRV